MFKRPTYYFSTAELMTRINIYQSNPHFLYLNKALVIYKLDTCGIQLHPLMLLHCCTIIRNVMILNSTFKYLTFVAFNLNGISISLHAQIHRIINMSSRARERDFRENSSKERQDARDASICKASAHLSHRKCTRIIYRAYLLCSLRQEDWRRLQRSHSKQKRWRCELIMFPRNKAFSYALLDLKLLAKLYPIACGEIK